LASFDNILQLKHCTTQHSQICNF